MSKHQTLGYLFLSSLSLYAFGQESASKITPSIAIKEIRTADPKVIPTEDFQPKYADQGKVLRQTITAQDCDPVTIRPIRFSITQEQINLSSNRSSTTYNERIGLTGVTANIEDPNGFFLGAGRYFASTGKR